MTVIVLYLLLLVYSLLFSPVFSRVKAKGVYVFMFEFLLQTCEIKYI